MPELPDIEIIKEFLAANVVGQTISAVEHVGPIVVRNLLPGDVPSLLTGKRIASAGRYGKFLLLGLDDGLTVVINFMLSGRLMYCPPTTRRGPKTFLVLALSSGRHLRCTDPTQMGKIYLANDLAQVPTFSEQGPDALEPALTLEAFRERLRRHPGEIKSTLTNQSFVAGIGNAYADEILFAARVYPFRKRPSLPATEIEGIYAAMHSVLHNAIATLRERTGSDIHIEIRDFLQVHGKEGRPCPRCGASITEVSANRRITNFCRTCQPGTLIRP